MQQEGINSSLRKESFLPPLKNICKSIYFLPVELAKSNSLPFALIILNQ